MDEELTADEQPTVQRISRRKALKRIGVAGAAAAWSAPLISSLRTPAFAQSSPRCSTGFVCGNPAENCGTFCNCTTTVDGVACLSDFCSGVGLGCTTNDECATLLGPGAMCQPTGAGCCGNQCLAPCGSTTAGARVAVGAARNSG